jgi:hypothetical protein
MFQPVSLACELPGSFVVPIRSGLLRMTDQNRRRGYGRGVKITASPPPGARWTLSLSLGLTYFVLMVKLVPAESASGPSAKI